ncbi:MAG: histidinol dehydrogenase [Planctomycetota bacterium]
MTTPMLRRVAPGDVARELRPPVDGATLADAGRIIEDVRARGEVAVREFAERFGERRPDEPLVLDRDAMRSALEALDGDARGVLERAANRIARFAEAQRASFADLDTAVPGGRAGHALVPVCAAGCYAPAGRYPLPSSVLMTAVPARVAGCDRVVLASPGAHPVAVAAAAIAGADAFLAVGGAHAVAALAYGFDGFDRVDIIAGPGNRWVTAAKQLVSGIVGIDMLAGPSELLVIADDSADPTVVAADLLAQAEHDADAMPLLVTTSASLADGVDEAISSQLEQLATAGVARQALRNGIACVCGSTDELVRVADGLTAEHVQVFVRDAADFAGRLRHAGALFIGESSAEVLGDYGAGPNHTLPTGGTARFRAGLSVLDFLRPRTWLDVAPAADPAGYAEVVRDAAALAAMEGLDGHRRAALARGSATAAR